MSDNSDATAPSRTQTLVAQSTAASTEAARLVYKPPMRGAPTRRVGGASRGSADDATLAVLAPQETGFATEPSPALYWYLAKPTAAPVVFTLITPERIDPIAEIALEASRQAGIRRMALADHGIAIEPDVTYEWSIAIVRDPDDRSADVIASGTVRRVEPAETLSGRLMTADPEAKLLLLAEAGYWYDAIDLVSRRIEAEAADEKWVAFREGLLDQVGLDEVADDAMR